MTPHTLDRARLLGGLAALALTAFARPAQASIVVDGLMGDWGVSPATSQWVPNAGVQYAQADNTYSIPFGFWQFAGQQFDVEAIYYTAENNTAHFAVVSGFPLEGLDHYWTADDAYHPGDLAFDFSSDGTYEFGVATTGTHYLYSDPVWLQTDQFLASSPYAVGSGIPVGTVGFGYNSAAYAGSGHYAFEVSIPTSLFGSYMDGLNDPGFTVHWTMSCGNDMLNLFVTPPVTPPIVPPNGPPPILTIVPPIETSPPVVPEPSSMMLLLTGLAGLSGFAKASTRRRP